MLTLVGFGVFSYFHPIFQPYPPIQYADDIVRIGVLPDSEFHDINFFCVDNSIDLQIGVLVQLGEYYEAFG